MILASGIVMFVVAYIVLVAKLYLWFYLAVGPLFIVLATFNATTQFFWSWVKCVVTSVVTMMVAFFIVGVVVYVSEHVIDASVSSLGTVQKTINVLGDSAGLVAILLLMALIAYQAPHVAASLTGGSPMSQGGSLARDVMRFVQSRGLGAAGPGTSGSVQPQGAMGRMMRGAQQLAGRATSAVGLRTQMAYQRAAAAARSRW
jgi:type IV secretory pathway VirB6-like protein